jgi:hypothetical protein
MNCEQARNQDLVEKYVAGQLHEPEMSAFEEHYFGCDECLASVQLGQAIIHGNTGQQSKIIEMPARSAVRRPRWIYAAAAAAAAVVITLIGWRTFSSQPAMPQVAQNQPQSPIGNPAGAAPSQPAEEARLLASNLDLGSIEPLAYRPSVLRGVNEDASQRFSGAMEAYLKHDYRQSATNLAAIPAGVPNPAKPEAHITDAGVQLYLGISQMMLNENTAAIRSLRRSSAFGDTPYVENAGFYLAKALIREKQYTAAAAELKRVIRLNGDRQTEAERLLAQLSLQVQAK